MFYVPLEPCSCMPRRQKVRAESVTARFYMYTSSEVRWKHPTLKGTNEVMLLTQFFLCISSLYFNGTQGSGQL